MTTQAERTVRRRLSPRGLALRGAAFDRPSGRHFTGAPRAHGAQADITQDSTGIDRTWRWFLVGLVILLVGFLIGPRVLPGDQQEICVGNIELGGPFGFSLNCDSPQFMRLARDPAGLLESDNARQARPGLIVAAGLLQAPLSVIAPPGGPPKRLASGLRDPPEITASLARDVPAYLAYVALNIGILLASFLLMRKILDGIGDDRKHDGAEAAILASAGLLLVANDVTKAFVWSPHTQMFNILVPVMALYAVLQVWSDALQNRRFTLALGAAVGFGITAYPVFVIIPACCLVPGIFRILQQKLPRARRVATVNLVLLLTLSALPSVLWYAFVRAITGDFFHFEMAQGEVVWMAEAWAKGATVLFSKWLSHAWHLIAFVPAQAIPVAALAALGAWALRRSRDTGTALRFARPIMAAGIYVSAAALGFYTCVGWLVWRLAYPMLPPLLVAATAAVLVISRRLDDRDRRRVAAVAVALAGAQIVYEIGKNGPWS